LVTVEAEIFPEQMHKCGYTTNIVSINIWHALANMSGSGANNSSTTTTNRIV